MAKIDTKDWRNLPIENWNCNSFTQYIVDRTEEIYGVPYVPGGRGSKAQRWLIEKSLMKQAQGTYGNAVLRRFIEICQREYRTNKPEQYPYATFTFMYAYQDRYFTQAQSEIAKEARRADAEQAMAAETAESNEDLKEWW